MVAVPTTGKVTRTKIANDRKAKMDLMAYQTGAFDTIESRLAYLEQQGQFWGVDEEMSKELVRKRAVSRAAHGKPIVPLAPELGHEGDRNFVTGAFLTDDVAADAQGSVFGALAPSATVAAAAARAQRRLRRRGCGCGPSGFGVAPIVAGGVSLAAGAIKSSATKGRLQENQDNYTAVMNGTASADNCCPTPQSALDQLTNRAGYGPAGVAATGDGATKDDARAKLGDLLATGTIFGPPLPTGFQRVRYTIAPSGAIPGAGATIVSKPPAPFIRPPTPPAFVDGGGTLPQPTPAGPSITDQVGAAIAKLWGGGPPAPAPSTSITITAPSAPAAPAPRAPRTRQAGLFGGGTLVTLALIGAGALVLSKVVGGRR